MDTGKPVNRKLLEAVKSVKTNREVELQARHVPETAHRPEGRNHAEAGQHLQVLLVAVLELVLVGGGIARPDAEVIQDHLVARVAVLALTELAAEGLLGIDRHLLTPSAP